MTTHIKSINRKVWKVVETKIEIDDPENPTAAKEVLLQNNDIALSAIHDAINEKTFEQIKNIEMAHEAWKKLEESFEGTKAMKGAKAYILKEKFASFKMKKIRVCRTCSIRWKCLSIISKHLVRRWRTRTSLLSS